MQRKRAEESLGISPVTVALDEMRKSGKIPDGAPSNRALQGQRNEPKLSFQTSFLLSKATPLNDFSRGGISDNFATSSSMIVLRFAWQVGRLCRDGATLRSWAFDYAVHIWTDCARSTSGAPRRGFRSLASPQLLVLPISLSLKSLDTLSMTESPMSGPQVARSFRRSFSSRDIPLRPLNMISNEMSDQPESKHWKPVEIFTAVDWATRFNRPDLCHLKYYGVRRFVFLCPEAAPADARQAQ